VETTPSQPTTPVADQRTEGRLLIIGWKERLDFVHWPIRRVKVKIDTGARTSALGVESCELHPNAGQGFSIRLRLALHRRHPQRIVEIETPVLAFVRVRNTSGQCEQRPLIETDVCLGPVRKRIRLTIANRAAMRHTVILGREALAGDFLVDVSRRYLLRSVPCA
jgi:hypothetical protein